MSERYIRQQTPQRQHTTFQCKNEIVNSDSYIKNFIFMRVSRSDYLYFRFGCVWYDLSGHVHSGTDCVWKFLPLIFETLQSDSKTRNLFRTLIDTLSQNLKICVPHLRLAVHYSRHRLQTIYQNQMKN